MKVKIDLKLTKDERDELVKHLAVFNSAYTVSVDGDCILYGEDYEELSDKDALKDLYEWLTRAVEAAKWLDGLTGRPDVVAKIGYLL